jgi:hypothetical protein
MSEVSGQNQGCFGYILDQIKRLLGKTPQVDEVFPYKIRDDFLSPAELSYYQVLKSVLGPRAAISPKVRLADILYVTNQKNYMSFFGRISQRHVDFLLCEASTMKPVLVIELDDSSHRQSRQVSKDEFLDNALRAADLPILRIKAQRQYSQEEVIAHLTPLLSRNSHQTKAPPVGTPIGKQSNETSPEPLPSCPICGETMVVRVAAHGKHKGSRFYGCTNYPKCKGVLPYPKHKLTD